MEELLIDQEVVDPLTHVVLPGVGIPVGPLSEFLNLRIDSPEGIRPPFIQCLIKTLPLTGLKPGLLSALGARVEDVDVLSDRGEVSTDYDGFLLAKEADIHTELAVPDVNAEG